MTAAGMLLSGDFNVSEVAFAVGFEDIYAFSHAFKKVMGVSHSRFKEDALLKNNLVNQVDCSAQLDELKAIIQSYMERMNTNGLVL